MSDQPLLSLHLRFFKLNLHYFHNPRGIYGNRLMIGSRNWLRPGEYLWSVTIKRRLPNRYRKWRSVWRRPIPALHVPPVYSAWHKCPRRSQQQGK